MYQISCPFTSLVWYQRLSLSRKQMHPFRNKAFLRWGIVNSYPKFQAGGRPLVGYLHTAILHIAGRSLIHKRRRAKPWWQECTAWNSSEQLALHMFYDNWRDALLHFTISDGHVARSDCDCKHAITWSVIQSDCTGTSVSRDKFRFCCKLHIYY